MTVVTPGVVGGTQVPTSPVVYDMIGGVFQEMTLQTEGACRIEWMASINSVDAADEDFSNIQWTLIGTQLVPDAGRHKVPSDILRKASSSRYIKMDPVSGASVLLLDAYGT